ncbi:MAG: efflux RND transporter permease subunit [Gammaproteobacteria bacterium]|nr:efflux RND transporter permease subunit [Gammaproteobacteria bacterium]
MNFVTWAIRNPIPVIVLFVVLTAGGLISFQRLGVQGFPDIALPGVNVSMSYPGAPPGQMETEITRKIEDAVSNVVGVQHITSQVAEGASTTFVEFQFGTDLAQAVDDVRDAITRVRSNLPNDANEPVISRLTIAGEPVVTFGVDSSTLTEAELSWLVDLTVTREISAVPGVGSIRRVGGVTREIRVDLDPDRMAALGATASDVSRQLKRIQTELPGGTARVGGREQNVRAVGTLGSAQELEQLPILLSDGRSLRLDAIADVRDQGAERRQLALHNGKPVVAFAVWRAWGQSAVGVADDARAAVERLQRQYPQVRFTEIHNTVEEARQSFHDSLEMLLEGALLAIIVVWLFLRDWRATFISATALPLAVIPTFWAIYALGYTLNMLSLLALSLVVGMLVDDAIVEVENNVRHLHMGKSPLQAATDAAQEIGLAVVATTLTLCAVFLPVAFMSGVPGQIFKPFAFTATSAVLCSLLVARLLTPAMSAKLLRDHGSEVPESRLLRRYLAWVDRCLAHRWRTLGGATLIFSVTIALGALLPTEFAPRGEAGLVQFTVELTPGSTLQETRAAAEAVRQRLARFGEVAGIYTIVGDGNNVRTATVSAQLVPLRQRSMGQSELQRAMVAALADIPGARITTLAQTGSKLQISLVGDDSGQLALAATAVARDLTTIPGLGAVTSSASLLQPEVVIRPQPERAAELGVTTEAISTAVRFATAGDVDIGLAKLNLPDRQVPIRVRLNDSARNDIERLRLLPVPGLSGPVPLVNVADISLGTGPAQIDRYDRSRTITLSADLEGLVLGDALRQVKRLPAYAQLPAGVRPADTGDARFFLEMVVSFVGAMIIGVLSIYVLLVLLFKDFIQPVTILSALPPSVGGAIIALLLGGYSLSMPALIGMLTLMGIVTKNSILLVEYAVMARRRGLDRHDALIDACAKRARPILMTTIAMGAGMLPIALGWSGDPSFRSPMGVAVIGGLLASTALSLFVVPAAFTVLDDLRLWLRRRLGAGIEPQAAVAMPLPVD